MNHRPRLILDGVWKFWKDPDNSFSPQNLLVEDNLKPGSINVPSAWQSQSVDLRYYSGAAWYRREVEIPEDWISGSSIILGIDASDYLTEVWLNDIKVGEHEGGYLPFEFDVSLSVRPGTNTLTIRVDDPPSLFHEIPHGKQGWYGPLSGIWQSVWIEKRSPLHIHSIQVFSDLTSGNVLAQVVLSSSENSGIQLSGRLFSPNGELVASNQVFISAESALQQVVMDVKDPMPWSPDEPNLYWVEVDLLEKELPVDSISKQFGFRTIEARDSNLFLNGNLIYLRGALDQDYYPDTIISSPTVEYLEDQLLKAKDLGLNCLRCHIKAADPRYYDVADRLGMLIWTELPNWSVFTERAGKRGRETLAGIVTRDGHHPSIIAWTIINENWGMDLVNDPAHQAWLVDTYHWLKKLDPTRLVIDNSPCEPNFHIQTDVEDYHYYRAIPDHRREWDQFVGSFASRAAWTFSPNGVHVRTRKEPLIVSEFGNWGLPDIDLLSDEKGQDPWWYETGFEWGEGVVYPQGIRSRFQSLGLDRVFGSWRGLVEATQWQQYEALKYQIEAMRRQPEIVGYVITELTDVHWECNGLLDMRRNPKVFFEKFSQINADTVIITDWERISYWSGESIQIGVRISHAAGSPLSNGKLLWRLDGENTVGWIEVPSVEPGQVKEIGEIHFLAPRVVLPEKRVIQLELRDSQGKVITNNHLALTVFPNWELTSSLEKAQIYSELPGLVDRLDSLGYSQVTNPDSANLIISAQAGNRLLSHLQSGGRALILADRAEMDGSIMPGVRRISRPDTPWAGDWASSFSWINRQGVFKKFPEGPLIDFSFDRVIPASVLTGFREWEFSNLVRAGIFVGWIHKPAALIGERFYGNGKAVVNTFHLSDPDLGTDPVATNLLNSLIELSLDGSLAK